MSALQTGSDSRQRKGEYEGYCFYEILLTRLQQASDITLPPEIQEIAECKRRSFKLYSTPTSRRVCTYPHPSFPSYLAVNI